MSASIFADVAPRFWELGLRCVPIEPNSKRPAKELISWQGYLSALPNSAKRAEWLANYSENGIGLLCGSEIIEGIVLVGLDVDDDRLVSPVERLLKFSNSTSTICVKKGKKGATFFVGMPKGGGTRSTILQGAGELGNIDVLAGGKMTVMPPSIHPDTGKPYFHVGPALSEVPFENLPTFAPSLLAALGIAIGSEEIVSIMEGISTHDPGVALAGRLVAKKATDEEISLIFRAFLPDRYSGDTLNELSGWIESAREKGFGNPEGKGRASLAAALVAMAVDSCEFFNDGDGSAYVTVQFEDGSATYEVNAEPFNQYIRHRAFSELGKPAGRNPLSEAVDTLEAIALYSSETKPVFRRVGGNLDRIEIDLGRRDGNVVAITAKGWTVELEPQHKFTRGAGFRPLPNPRGGGDLQKLRELLGLEQTTFRLLLAFLLNALKPDGPYLILMIEGEQGSGKSFLMDVIKRIIDPNMAKGIRLPDNERDLMIQAKAFWLLNFDNASGIKGDISDALCSLATGGGIAIRKLYSNGELNIISYARPFIINGISNFVSRPDLMERAIPLRLSPMPEGGRKEEAVLLAEFEAMLPEILGVLYDAAARAIRDRDHVVPPTNLRMADAARWIIAGETAFGLGNESALDAITEAQDDLLIERVNDDPLVIKLRESSIFGRTFEGTVGELFVALECGSSPTLPKTPSHLSKALARLRPAMSRAGVQVESLGKTNKGMRLRVTVEAKGPPPFTKF